MMKHIAITLSIMLMGATAASAQGIEFRPGGSGGVSIGVGSDRGRYEERGMRRGRHDREDRVMVRGRDRDIRSTGNVGCRTTVVKKEDRFGRMTTKRIKTCE